ncbi:Alpha/Beta hydrolase protein [Leptodontidium sp. 2 PMI_412]|nr:Alpha/Beta hydrolase protein [Leptodontidium sp. 2 PMI_412]
MGDRHTLLFSQPLTSPHPVDLPPYITRYYIPTPLGTLELLAAEPTSSPTSGPRKKAILFQHGGFGSAAVFIPFLTYFSQAQHPCYALSVRGHGASWKPSFFRMVWGYPKSAFAGDLLVGLGFVQDLEAERRGKSVSEVPDDVVLVGHSAGGELTQFLLSEGMRKVGGYVCMAGFPSFGGWGVYWNWFKMDPWFVPRYYLRDFWHPRSPLSSTSLVHQAFFSPSYPVSDVKSFETLMPEYESMLWPLQMMTRFVDVGRVVRSITGWGKGGIRLLVVAGEKDRLMDVELMRQMAAEYRVAVEKGREELVGESGGDVINGGEQVGFEVVMGSGHHLQNDLYWEDCAGKILVFVEQL